MTTVANRILTAMGLYCGWLNSHAPKDYQLTLDDMDLQMQVRLFDVGGYDAVALNATIKLEDEPAGLVLMFDEGELIHAIQTFDGHCSLWYHEGKPHEWGTN